MSDCMANNKKKRKKHFFEEQAEKDIKPVKWKLGKKKVRNGGD